MADETTAATERVPRIMDLGGAAMKALAASAPDVAETRPQKDTEPPSRTVLTRQETEALEWVNDGKVKMPHRHMEAVLLAAQSLPRPHTINAIRNLEQMGRISWDAQAGRYVDRTGEGTTNG